MELNGIILIDKQQEWTSHDVVAKLRGILKERRIGHAGTLDPMATGLLTVFVGKSTKGVEFATAHDKEYHARLRLGISTDTQDITGNVIKTSPVNFDKAQFEAVLEKFKGEIEQIPPMYSAVKVGGQRLYKIARRGDEIEREARKITVSEICYEGEIDGDICLKIVCSKGTYIRTICHDIGEALGCGGTMSYLRRTRSGAYLVENALTLDEVQALVESGEIQSKIMPLESVFSEFEQYVCTDFEEKKCRCGVGFKTTISDGTYRISAQNGDFLMLGKAKNGFVKSIKNFF